MSLMKNYTVEEQISTIAFLKMVARSDDIIKEEEEKVIDLLANNLHISESDIIGLGESKIKYVLRSLTKNKTLELLRMGYTILDIDDHIHINEIKVMDYLASSHNIKIDHSDFLDQVLVGSKELTPLDTIILISLIYQMMFSDSKIHTNELRYFETFLNDHGLSKNEVKGLIVPIPILTKAVKTMSKPSVNKIIEHLVTIAVIDDEFSKEEFDVLFPLLSENDINLDYMIDKIKKDHGVR